jgi:hypothetical protein
MTPAPLDDSGRHDFDFFHGRWLVHNRRLKEPLSGSDEWTEFDGEQVVIPMLDGLGCVDEMRTDAGALGDTLRFYNRLEARWYIWWVSSRDGALQPPVSGTWRDGIGRFEGDDTHVGKPIRVRFTWSSENPAAPRWQQEFSADGGVTWELNWVMQFRRDTRAQSPPWPRVVDAPAD